MRASQGLQRRHAATARACAVLAVLLVCGVATASASPGSGLLSAAAQDTAPGDHRPQRIKAFMHWATSNGVTVAPGLMVQPFEQTGYHVVATADVGLNTTLFTVPVDVAVRVDSKHTDFVSVFAAELASGWWSPEPAEGATPNELRLVALVLYERFYVARSFWQPYWDICPPDFDFLPPYFSDDEKELATVSAPLQLHMQRFEQLRAVWRNETLALARLRPDVFGARSRANDALLGRRIDWAINAVLTRGYQERFESDVSAMVPLSDLLNHAPGHRTMWWGEYRTTDEQGQVLTRKVSMYLQSTHQPVAAGAELAAAYTDPTRDCNAIHLAHYGFTVADEGVCDCAHLHLHLGTNPDLWPHREHDVRLLHAANVVDKRGTITIAPRFDFEFEHVAPVLLPVLRAMTLHQADQPLTEQVVQQLRDVVTMESELRMCRTAAEVLKGVVAAEEAKLANAWARVMARRGGQEPTIAMRHIRHVSEGSVRVFRRLITALEKYWVTLLYRADP